MDVGRLAVDGDLPGPGQGRATSRSISERPAVLVHLLVAERPQDRRREDGLHEEVLFHDHFLAGVRSQPLEDAPCLLGPLVPGDRSDDGLHVGDARHPVTVAVGPVEPECRPPVVDDEGDVIAEVELVQQAVEVAAVVHEPVRAGALIVELVRVAMADQIRGDAPGGGGQVGDHVAPQV